MSDAFEGVEFYIHPSCIAEGSEIGRGGFGVVLQGLLKEDGQEKQVALKCPLPDAPEQQETLFESEVTNTISISQRCPHVIQCYGFSTTKSGQTCLVTQLYTGGTLHALLSEHLDDPLPPQERACIAKDVVEAVRHLHQQGMIAEDLKPGNVLLDGSGGAVLSDFGALKSLGSEASVMATEEVIGTLFFLPPEKLRRDAGDKFHVGFSSDVWSLGVLLLQLACCNLWLPYGPGVDVSNVAAQLNLDREPPAVPPLPDMPGMQQLIQRCLQLQPSDRIQIDELAEGVARVLSRVSTGARPTMGPDTDRAAVPGPSSLDQTVLGRRQAALGPHHLLLESKGGMLPEPRAHIGAPAQAPLRKLSSRNMAELRAAVFAAKCMRASVIIDLCGLEFVGEMASDCLKVPPGCTIRNGSILLPDSAQICIEDSDASLENLEIRGARSMKYAIPIRGASSVWMEGCRVEGGCGKKGSAAVGVAGPRKDVGSRLAAHGCHMHSCQGSGLIVNGSNCTATLNACSICNCYGSNLVVRTGSATLQDCRSTESKKCGLSVSHSGSAVVKGGSISSNQQYNVCAQLGASTDIRECRCNSSSWQGLAVYDTGSSAAVRNCTICHNRGSNCHVQGGKVELEDTQMKHSTRRGLSVGSGGSAMARNCTISVNQSDNCVVVQGGQMDLKSCQVSHSKLGYGIRTNGPGSLVTVDSSTSITGNRCWSYRGSVDHTSTRCCQLM